jgi:pimeloyl-ACP methyl ester carboxylesterase
MNDLARHLVETTSIGNKVSRVYQHRATGALERFSERASEALKSAPEPRTPWQAWSEWNAYAADFAQRSVLMLDTLRQRGNAFVEHERSGLKPVLHFDYETVLDAREFERPVNYALVRIVPPKGVTVDPNRRPYVIVDPRAGHGPGIGGFKDDSQVGVALRDGHPVYFVIFFQRPEPDQTLLDVCEAEKVFIRRVHELHPHSPRPAIVGNCQGGWAAMMVAATAPEDCGPIVINGAPMSYWGGAWSEGKGDNPMRYAGGMLGGSWLASMTADLGNGIFDGAWLVQNFENLNPANTYWNKLYDVFSKVDTAAPRFLDFERWWGGFYLMGTEEIEWIVQNLFVGNKLWTGETTTGAGGAFDLRQIRSPIILFASLGDNITPPQQAFNWVADVYGSTEEIIARGQVIVGLLHEDVGHLGIFVSGKVANREHAGIVSVMKSIEALPPGLYAMQINDLPSDDGGVEQQVEFIPKRLEDVMERLNWAQRRDEVAFDAAAEVAEFNQRAYELFGRPLVKAIANEPAAELSRTLHPLRVERWAFSDLNPWTAWLAPAAESVRESREPVSPDNALRRAESGFSELVSASLDTYRVLRDAYTEAVFLQTFGSLHAFYFADRQKSPSSAPAAAASHGQSLIDLALQTMAEGGYPEAVARVGFLLRRGGNLELVRLERNAALIKAFQDLLPALPDFEMRRVSGQQAIVCTHDREGAIETLPSLVADPSDRDRLLSLLDLIVNDSRIDTASVTDEQRDTYRRILGVLGADKPTPARRPRRVSAS